MYKKQIIPKVIHYVWLSDEPLNDNALACIASWKKFAPDFAIKRWSMADFDFSQMPDFVNEAIKAKKWAFATDYLRLYVLYHHGGLYLDSDVLMTGRPHKYLQHRFVSSVEYYPELFAEGKNVLDANGEPTEQLVKGMAVQAAILASEPGHPLIGKVMEYYRGQPFILPDGSLNNKLLAPHVFAWQARSFGYRYKNEEQRLRDDAFLYKSEIFAPDLNHSRYFSVMIHLCNASWRDMKEDFRNAYSGSIARQIIWKKKRKPLETAYRIYRAVFPGKDK